MIVSSLHFLLAPSCPASLRLVFPLALVAVDAAIELALLPTFIVSPLAFSGTRCLFLALLGRFWISLEFCGRRLCFFLRWVL